MSSGAVQLWGWDTATWRKVITDAAGHLQVDIVAAPAAVGHCYGWDGAAWQSLLVESAADFNLRARLYGGANAVLVGQSSAAFAYTNYSLSTFAALYADDGTNLSRVGMLLTGADAVANTLNTLGVASMLYGYNGASWDRLRVMTPADAFATPTFALQVSSFLMGYDGADWNMVRVDAAGHLQVDVVSGAGVASQCYGYDGAAWQTLLVESAALKNLRVKLYDGAQEMSGGLMADTQMDVALEGGLNTRSMIWAYDAGGLARPIYMARNLGDGITPTNMQGMCSWGYNGATWDRLRTYGTGILKVGRDGIGATLTRRVAVGAVAAGAKKLMWITVRPSAATWVLALTDAIAGGGAVIWDEGGAAVEPFHCVFDPPIEFATGIYAETWTNLTAVTFSYV